MATATNINIENLNMDAQNARNEYEHRMAEIDAAKEKEKRIMHVNGIAEQSRELYDAYVHAGFTPEQAWEVCMLALQNSVNPVVLQREENPYAKIANRAREYLRGV